MQIISSNHNSSRSPLELGSPHRWGIGPHATVLPVLILLLNIGALLGLTAEAFSLEPVHTGESLADIVMKMGQGKSGVPMAPSNPRLVRTKETVSPKKAPWTDEAKAAPGSKESRHSPGKPTHKPELSKRAKSSVSSPGTDSLRSLRTPKPYLSTVSVSTRTPVSLLKKSSASDSGRPVRGLSRSTPSARLVKASTAADPERVHSRMSRVGGNRPALKKPVPHRGPRLSVEPVVSGRSVLSAKGPRVKAKAMLCVDCSSNKVVLAENEDEPLPIASITKLLTAMIVIDRMDLDKVLKVPWDIKQIPRHRVGLRPGELLTVRDLLHGLLIESGNDCAEVLARAYPRGGRYGFMLEMKKLAVRLGASHTKLYTPSGLDTTVILGRKNGRELEAVRSNVATAEDVALIARHAFKYPIIREIAGMKTYTMRTRNPKPRNYRLATNDKLLYGKLPVEGAKTGYTNLAGRCIVALFKNQDREHVVVVLNTAKHFKAAERIYRWVCKPL